ncbi:MAG: argininosuccinate lyase [Methanosaeta sp. PtaU1.Bin060]|jgi:predicted ATP-grasp superfamily ATP-dependent carboligase|nr:MAG: argininosuccinate lyase [Methanosaeta sp. PtaU1.Bin060]
MKILVAEYASALGLGGTCELEGRAMLYALAESFERAGHSVIYPTSGPTIAAGQPVFLRGHEDFEKLPASARADAGLLMAPDELQPHLLKVLEESTVNLGCSPEAARLCADKLLSTERLKDAGVPVAEIVPGPEPCEKGCHRYVIKPRSGCGSEGVRITSTARAGQNEIVTRYYEGLHLSASFIVGQDSFLPLTINRQLIEFEGDGMGYEGSEVPYPTPRADEIWEAVRKAAAALGLRGYAGIDFVLGDQARVVDVNARPTTSIIGIAKVMRESLGELILQASFGGMPERVHVDGIWSFRKKELSRI